MTHKKKFRQIRTFIIFQPTFLMGVLVAAGDFSRATGPLWGMWVWLGYFDLFNY